jgi:hypothetical protein
MNDKIICAICGGKNPTTKDHIPPKSLYPKPRDGLVNLNTVPACSSCNNGASTDDEIFKTLIGISTGDKRLNQDCLIESLASTLAGNKKIGKAIFSSAQKVSLKDAFGVTHRKVAINFDKKSYDRVISRIIRALYWMESCGDVLGDQVFSIFDGNSLSEDCARQFLDLSMTLPLKSLNGDSFHYRFFIENKENSFWGLQFFRAHMVFAFVGNRN